jgi:hypothetical protein
MRGARSGHRRSTNPIGHVAVMSVPRYGWIPLPRPCDLWARAQSLNRRPPFLLRTESGITPHCARGHVLDHPQLILSTCGSCWCLHETLVACMSPGLPPSGSLRLALDEAIGAVWQVGNVRLTRWMHHWPPSACRADGLAMHHLHIHTQPCKTVICTRTGHAAAPQP